MNIRRAGVLGAVLLLAGAADTSAGFVDVKAEMAPDGTGKCVAKLTAVNGKDPIEVSQKAGNVVYWTFTNACAAAQRVALCEQEIDGKRPFMDCRGDTSGTAVKGKEFLLKGMAGTAGATEARLTCTINWSILPNNACTPGMCPKRKFGIVNTPETEKPACPPAPTSTCPTCNRGYELTLEVVP